MLIPQYIVSHHALPNGMEEAVRHPLWGFSYALYPYLTALISSVFMGIASLFTGKRGGSFNRCPPHERPFRHRHADRCFSDRRGTL